MIRRGPLAQLYPPSWPAIVTVGIVLAVIPFAFGPYVLSVLIAVGLSSIVAVGLSLFIGYAGQISLGHAGFYGIGAYTSAILALRGVDGWATILIGMAITGGVAWLVSRPTLRLEGHYLAMATLGLGMILNIIMIQWTSVTGGPSGLTGIPPLTVGSFVFDADWKLYYLIWVMALLVIWGFRNLVHSRVGRALKALAESEAAASSLGVPTARFKEMAFILSAMAASLAGSLYAFYLSFVSPSTFDAIASIEFLIMAIAGGVRSVWGAPVGAAVVTILSQAMKSVVPALFPSAGGEYSILVFGVLLVVILLFLPQGIVPGLARGVLTIRHRWTRPGDSGSAAPGGEG
ncbi:branched-chain amino acid ABC transporter permease [Kyrpidia tusciae]|uniref:Inner-membrane translocator n=1 Tax=Kyrpidia tusciae (strain DSM 2912 / NBRC 15312 / T2) TaxID=562970 RepID=D5WPN0_KYRT2|nr:branched-chain amino acid ABC transporter permease [Kyrpidia tusciae]ADG06289.1 inner-membrane translocator [Kyrpidia tusciae DSM 2912]